MHVPAFYHTFFRRKSSQLMLWAVLVSAVVAMAAAVRAANTPETAYEWPVVREHGSTGTLNAPAFLQTSRQTALIWQPPGAGTALVATPLDQMPIDIPILPYPDLSLRRWLAAPAESDTFHLVWADDSSRLQSALIDAEGQTVRGPVDLASDVQNDFAVLSHHTGRLLILWIDTNTQQLFASDIDDTGRPRAPGEPLLDDVSRIAAVIDQTDTVHLVWLTYNTPDSWMVNYHTLPAGDLTHAAFSEPEPLLLIPLAPNEGIASFAIGLDQTHGYLFCGLNTAARPDVERVYVLAFPLDRPGMSTRTELILPAEPARLDVSLSSELHTGLAAALPDSPDRRADLRWPRPAPGQHDLLPLAITLHTTNGWRPAVVYFRDGAALGFQVAAPKPADGGSPALAIDPAGNIRLAWTGLQDLTARVYTAYTAGQGLDAQPANTPGLMDALIDGLVQVPLGLLWLAIPACLVMLFGDHALLTATGIYGASKLLYPPDLYRHIPSLLITFDLDCFAPGYTVGIAVFFVGLSAAALSTLANRFRRPVWQVWLVYALCDMFLTWIIFAGNMPAASHLP
jgi:hypothetical protein